MYVKPWHPELAKVGVRVLSQVISASSCERNWSAHGHTHTKIRNRLDPAATEKLVYVYSNAPSCPRREARRPEALSARPCSAPQRASANRDWAVLPARYWAALQACCPSPLFHCSRRSPSPLWYGSPRKLYLVAASPWYVGSTPAFQCWRSEVVLHAWHASPPWRWTPPSSIPWSLSSPLGAPQASCPPLSSLPSPVVLSTALFVLNWLLIRWQLSSIWNVGMCHTIMTY